MNSFDEESEFELIALLTGCSEYLPEVSEIISHEDFYIPSMGKCFFHMQELYGAQGSYIVEEMLSFAKENISPDSYEHMKASVLGVITPSLEGAAARARIIKQYSVLRKAKGAAEKLISSTRDTVEEDIESSLTELTALTMESKRSEPAQLSELLIDFIERKYSGKNKDLIRSGYEKLDGKLNMSRSDLLIIAARPSVGKTAFGISLALKLAFQKYRTTVFSLEMSKEQLLNRMAASVGQIPHELLKRNFISRSGGYDSALGKAADMLWKLPLFIEDDPNITVSKIKRCCQRNKSDVIIVDYLQLLTPQKGKKNSTRAEEVGEMTRQLKLIAKDLNALVIVLSQLNRAVENRASARPNLSDLRESGSIEQDANAVIFLSKEDQDDPDTDLLADIPKNRDGSTGTVIFTYDRKTQTLRESDREYKPAPKRRKHNYSEL